MKHMDEETRYAIRRGLEAHRSLTEIAKEIGVAGSTVSREIRNHLTVRRTGGHGQPFNDCEGRYFCEKRSICAGVSDYPVSGMTAASGPGQWNRIRS